jgi:hypothetical protein
MSRNRSLILGLTAITLAIIGSLYPTKSSTHIYSIDSRTNSRIDLPLARHSPDIIKIQVGCPQKFDEVGNVDVLQTTVRNFNNQGLYLSSAATGLVLVNGPTRITDIKCGALTLIRSNNNSWELLSQNQRIAVINSPIRVSTIMFNNEALSAGFSLSATIEVRGSETKNDFVRWMIWITAFLAFTGIFLVSRTRRRSTQLHSLMARPDFFDLLFGVSLFFWAIVGPIYLDDGWVTLTSDLSNGWNNYFTVFQTWDARVPIGTPQYLLYHLLGGISQNLIVLRLIPFLVILLGWRCVRTISASLFLNRNSVPTFFIYVIYFSFSMSWLMTIRPEPFVSTISLLSLHFILRFKRERTEMNILIACLFSGIALGIHTSGGVALTPLIYGAWLVLSDTEIDLTERIFSTIRSASVLVFVSLSAVFLATDVNSWRDNGRLFEKAVNQSGITDELQRYRWVMSGFPYDSMLRRSYIFLLAFCVIFFTLALIRKRAHLGLLLSAGPVMFLLITPTKWPWHFGSTVGLVSLALILMISEMSKWKVPSIVLGASFGCMMIFNTINSPEEWGFFFPSSPKEGLLGGLEDSIRNPWIAVLMIGSFALFSLVVRWAPLHRNVFASLVLTPVVFAALLPLSFGVRDLNTPTSLASMNLNSIRQPAHCGLGSDIMTPDLSSAYSLSQFAPVATYTPVTPGGYRELFVRQEAGNNFLMTPWMRIPRTQDFIVLPIAGTTTDTSRLEIQFSTDGTSGSEFLDTTIRQNFLDGSRLVLGPIVSAADSNWFRLRLPKSNSNKIGIPKAVPLKSLADLKKDGRIVQVDPYFKPLLPCLGSRSAIKGLATRPDFMVGDNPLLSTSPASILVDSHDFDFSRAYLNGGVVFPITWVRPLSLR